MSKTSRRRRKSAAGHSPTAKSLGRVEGYSRTRRDHQSEQAEDYVELIAALIKERGEARAVDMARSLGVTHVTVTKTLGRLQKSGLIKTEPYRAVFLTSRGRNLAAKARSRHKIVLDFLLAVGVPASSATLDAEGIEHHVSPRTLGALKQLTEKIKPPRVGKKLK